MHPELFDMKAVEVLVGTEVLIVVTLIDNYKNTGNSLKTLFHIQGHVKSVDRQLSDGDYTAATLEYEM
ncbi:uncharacterized protein V6R79_005629 [Siganus canaliculatus]